MEEFIKTLTEQMRCAKARDGVARELSAHITDQAEAYEQSGMEHDKAVEKAVREMGDPVEIGVSMDRIHRPQADWRMLLLTLALSIAGLLCMLPVYGLEYVIFRQSIFTLAGFAVIAVVYFIDYSIVGRIGAAAYIIMTLLLFVGKHYMRTINGRIPAMSMLVYLYIPIFAGILYQLRMRGYVAVVMGLAIAGITFVSTTALASSLTVAMNVTLIMVVMIFCAIGKGMFGGKKKYMNMITAAAVLAPILLSLCFLNVNRGSFRWHRVNAFFHWNEYLHAEGYSYGVIGDILENARLVGGGSIRLGEKDSVSSFIAANGLMPLGITHFYGVIAAVLMLVLLAAFVLRAAKIVRCQKNQLGFLVSMACSLVLFVNCFEGILVSIGLFPLTTTAIPFLTYGGSAAFVYAVLIGLILGVHRYEKVYTREVYTDQPRWRVSLKVEKR